MDDLTITLIRAGSMASIVTFMLSRGLEVRHGDLWYLGSRRVLLLKSLLSVDVIVPLITIAVIILVRPAKATAIGMLILSAAPVAPMILKKILQYGGTREYAINLHLILAVLTIVSTPITLELFSLAAGFHLDINPAAIAGLVGLSVILPISGGMIIKQLFPSVSNHIKWLMEAFSGALFIIVTIVVLLSTYQLLFMMDIRSYIAIALMITGSIIAGHLMAREHPGEQTTLALESAARNVNLTLLITSTFTILEKALPIIIPYIVISAIITTIYVSYQKRRLDRPEI
ncbi:MAG TPA: sodium:proton antiporter [Methanocella sp.]